MRQPINVHVFLFRRINGYYEYAIFQRMDDQKCWQGVSGGVEEYETIAQAALRESNEEAATPINSKLYKLDSISYLPSSLFKEHIYWDEDIIVCPMYFYAIDFDGEIIISSEHRNYYWLSYQQAYDLIYYSDQKIALWELNKRLLSNKMKECKEIS